MCAAPGINGQGLKSLICDAMLSVASDRADRVGRKTLEYITQLDHPSGTAGLHGKSTWNRTIS